MIDVRNLTKLYPGLVAVDSISFTVERGEIVGFLGPNGAGKTTTMRMLTGFLAPSAGSASIAGFDVQSRSLEVRRRIGYLPENNPLYTEMRVEDYLDFRARLRGLAKADRVRRIGEALDRCGLADRRTAIIQNLSKGYRQRVGIADAILHQPELVILDEPTIGLDPNQVRSIRDVIRDLGREHTVILSTHILSEVEKSCGRVLIVSRGRLVADGTPASIVQKITATGRIRVEIQNGPEDVNDALARLPGIRNIQITRRGDRSTYLIESEPGAALRTPIFRCAAERGWELLELGLERVSLEDAFVELTHGSKPIVDSQPPFKSPAAREAAK